MENKTSVRVHQPINLCDRRPVFEYVVTKQLRKMLFQCVQETLKPHAKYQQTKKA